MHWFVAILCLLLLVDCRADEPHISNSLPVATTTMKRLREDIVGNRSALIREDVVVEGYITTSDAEDNFFRTMVVEDGSSAVEVMMGINPLYRNYPEGLRVALCLKDCYAAYSYGVLQIGRKPEAYESYSVDYLGSREAADKVVVRGTELRDVEPVSLAIAELSSDYLGRLVSIDGVHLVASSTVDLDEGELLDDALWEGYAMFKDECGDSIAVYTRSYARYADEYIPSGELTLSGILQWGRYNGGKECYQLKMRYATDCTSR